MCFRANVTTRSGVAKKALLLWDFGYSCWNLTINIKQGNLGEMLHRLSLCDSDSQFPINALEAALADYPTWVMFDSVNSSGVTSVMCLFRTFLST